MTTTTGRRRVTFNYATFADSHSDELTPLAHCAPTAFDVSPGVAAELGAANQLAALDRLRTQYRILAASDAPQHIIDFAYSNPFTVTLDERTSTGYPPLDSLPNHAPALVLPGDVS